MFIKHLLPFLKIGVIYEDFHYSGKIPDDNDLLNKEVIAGVSMNAHFKNNGEISSGPIAVLKLIFQSSLKIFICFNSILLIVSIYFVLN